MSASRPVTPGREADTAARDVVEEAGYGEESARPRPRTGDARARSAAAVPGVRGHAGGGQRRDVEPGIYLSGLGEIRIEDLVIVRDDGPEILTTFTKELVTVLRLEAMAETVNTNQFKNGMHIELEGVVWRIVDFQHVKPGKGGAFVRTKLKALESGAVVDKTFRAGEKFSRVHTETKNIQYLYDSGDDVVFMDEESYEQINLPRTEVAEVLEFLQPSSSVQMLTVDGRPSGVQLPSAVELTVKETQPGVKGDTVSNVTKPATLETGAVVQVPLFVNEGDKIRVDPRERRYISRA